MFSGNHPFGGRQLHGSDPPSQASVFKEAFREIKRHLFIGNPQDIHFKRITCPIVDFARDQQLNMFEIEITNGWEDSEQGFDGSTKLTTTFTVYAYNPGNQDFVNYPIYIEDDEWSLDLLEPYMGQDAL
ncbi:MAG: hypothetical protein EZS28_023750, partial [Streblomastix strix]